MTPLISLGEVGLLDALRVLYAQIVIPTAVYREYQAGLSHHPQRPNLDGISWLTTLAAPADPNIPTTLDPGEAEALALAHAREARLVLIDEQRGRRVARQLGLPVTGSLGVLLEATSHGIITLVGPHLDSMMAQGRHIGPRLRAQILELAGE